MKNSMIYVWTLLGLVLLSTAAEMTSYPLFGAPAPAGFGAKEVAALFLVKILFDFVFILMFRLARGSRLAENGPLYRFLWFLGFSVPSEIGYWLVFKYEVVIAYAGLASGLVSFPIKGWIVKKVKLP
jgi:hypothetical protein